MQRWLVGLRALHTVIEDEREEIRSRRREFPLKVAELQDTVRRGLSPERHVAPEVPGAIGLVSSLVFVAGGIQRFAVTSNGVFFGFFATAYTAVVLGVLPQAAFNVGLLRAKLAYVLLSYYAASSLTVLLSKDDLAREKYEFLFSGAQALAAGWKLARGFGPDASVFAGFLYLGCTFTTLALSELLFRKVFRIFGTLLDAGERRAWQQIEGERFVSLQQLRKGIRRSWRDNRAELIFGIALFLVWPLAIAIVAVRAVRVA